MELKKPTVYTLDLKVVGVSFRPDYPKNLLELADKHYQPESKPRADATLLREPDNAFDKNAVKVLIGDSFIGYVPKEIAAKLAPIMDRGKFEYVAFVEFLINKMKPNNPGAYLLADWWENVG